MARAGYDPNDLARMFETIEKQGRSRGGPEWLSDHPNPGNRSQYIAAEARAAPDRAERRQRARLPGRQAGVRRAAGGALDGRAGPARRQRRRRQRHRTRAAMASTGTPGQPVPRAVGADARPSAADRSSRSTCPTTGATLSANNYIRYVPENAFGPMNGQNVLTHGVELGVARAASADLPAATDTFIQGLMQGEPTVQRSGEARVVTLAGRRGLATPLANRSPLGGDERLAVYTVAARRREPVLRADGRPRARRSGLCRHVRKHPPLDPPERSPRQLALSATGLWGSPAVSRSSAGRHSGASGAAWHRVPRRATLRASLEVRHQLGSDPCSSSARAACWPPRSPRNNRRAAHQSRTRAVPQRGAADRAARRRHPGGDDAGREAGLPADQHRGAAPRHPRHGRRRGPASARPQGRLRAGEADPDDVVRADARSRRDVGSGAAAARRRGAGDRGALHHASTRSTGRRCW